MSSKKLTTFYVFFTLMRYSDEDHYLTQQEIINHIRDSYGLTIDRKTVASALADLESLDFDIKVKSNHKGVCLISRVFDSTEVRFLIDAIYSAHSISQSDARKLVDEILEMRSVYEQKNYSGIYKSYDNNRTNNKQLFYNIEVTQEAIETHKQIKFFYLRYDIDGNLIPRRSTKRPDEDHVYRISPYYLVNNFGRYYVLGSQYGFDKLVTYRVDFINEIAISHLEAIDKDSLSSFKDFDINSYMKKHIYMFNNPVVTNTLSIQKGQEERGITTLYDWFGENARCFRSRDEVKAEVVAGRKDLVYFVLQYSDIFLIEGPDETRDEMKAIIEKIRSSY